MSIQLSNEEKINQLNFHLNFWKKILKNNNDSTDFLNNLGNQVKIDQNIQYTKDCKAIIDILEQQIDNLS